MTRGPAHSRRALLLLSIGLAGVARGQGASDNRDLAAQLGEQAVRANRGVAAIGTQIRALEERVRAAGAWADPMLSISYQNMPVDRWVPGGSPMSGIQLAVKQSFYWPGKRAARQEEADAAVAVERWTLAEQKVQLRAMVHRAYYRLTLVRQLRRITAEHIKLVEQLIDAVRVKYEVGKVGQHDLLRLQVLKGRLTDDLDSFARDDSSLCSSINAALHRAAKLPITTPERLHLPEARSDLGDLAKLAALNRPLLRRYLAQAAARRASASRAAREGYPDISVWFGYTFRIAAGADRGTDFASIGLSVPIPLSFDRRWGSKARTQELMAKAAEEGRESAMDKIRGDIGGAIARWKRALSEAHIYRDQLMPDAHKTLDATFAAYQVGRADFANLFQAELQLLTFERTIRKAETSAALARVEVETLVGTPLMQPAPAEKPNDK